jgi:hypothetical protein
LPFCSLGVLSRMQVIEYRFFAKVIPFFLIGLVILVHVWKEKYTGVNVRVIESHQYCGNCMCSVQTAYFYAVLCRHHARISFIPRHWWHAVQGLDTAIAVNVWMPHAADAEERVVSATFPHMLGVNSLTVVDRCGSLGASCVVRAWIQVWGVLAADTYPPPPPHGTTEPLTLCM